jgi:adenine-specific DNA-methyltransferase
MRYIGSKVSTLPRLAEMVKERAPEAHSLCDPFAGTCTVARQFKRIGLSVTTGDLLKLSYVFQLATVRLNRVPRFATLLNSGILARESDDPGNVRIFRHLNILKGHRGYVTRHFSEASDAQRLFFTLENAMRIDAIRTTIAAWRDARLVSETEEAYLLAALIDATDKVANTAGTYFAHLKRFSRKSLKDIWLVAPPVIDNRMTNTCHLSEASDLVSRCTADILYLDPPYNRRDYSGYYHLPETLARGEHPRPSGKSGIPTHTRQLSDFCSPPRATAALENVVRRARARYIIVHYTPHGLIPHERIMTMLNDRGRTTFEDLPVRAYSATPNMGHRTVTHRIYWCEGIKGDR